MKKRLYRWQDHFASFQETYPFASFLDGPREAVLSVNSTYTIKEGDSSKSISCTADCYPDCRVHWTREEDGNSSTVIFPDTVTRNMSGTYTCVAVNPESSNASISTLSLTVQCKRVFSFVTKLNNTLVLYTLQIKSLWKKNKLFLKWIWKTKLTHKRFLSHQPRRRFWLINLLHFCFPTFRIFS